jgi:hypothetical protein
MFLGLPDPDPLVRGMDPDPDPALTTLSLVMYYNKKQQVKGTVQPKLGSLEKSFRSPSCESPLKVLSSEMDSVEIRLNL